MRPRPVVPQRTPAARLPRLSRVSGGVSRGPSHPHLLVAEFAPSSFQRLTNCLRFVTLSELLCFQAITNCSICKSFVLITIQQYRGWVCVLLLASQLSGMQRSALTPLKCALTNHLQVTENTATLSPLECAVTRFRAVTPLECAVPKNTGGGGIRAASPAYSDRVLQCAPCTRVRCV
jgi:hypothetical protein